MDALKMLGNINLENLLQYFEILGIKDVQTLKSRLLISRFFDGDSVISFKTGKPIDTHIYDPRPETETEYECFFRNALEIAGWRTLELVNHMYKQYFMRLQRMEI